MHVRRAILAVAVTIVVVVLLVTFKTHSTVGVSPGPPSVRQSSKAVPSQDSASASSSGLGTSISAVPLPTGRHVVRGDVIQVEFGPVQVELTVADRKITNVDALQLPDAVPMDSELSRPAAARLERAVIAAQSVDVDSVSGATFTSDGYLRSLQSALDRLRG